jgi:hypothetical protein
MNDQKFLHFLPAKLLNSGTSAYVSHLKSNDGAELCLLYPWMDNGNLSDRLGKENSYFPLHRRPFVILYLVLSVVQFEFPDIKNTHKKNRPVREKYEFLIYQYLVFFILQQYRYKIQLIEI